MLCEILFPIMHALSDAHARELVRRDLEPANIFLHRERDDRTTPKLLAIGFTRGASDAAADVRAVAATVYRALTGNAPVDDGGRQPLPEARPELPRAAAFEAVIARALSVDTAQRTASLAQLMGELGAAAEIDPAAVLADRGLGGARASDRPARTSQAEELGAADLASLTQVLDPTQLPPPRSFQRIANVLAIALFVIAVVLVGSAMRRSPAPQPTQGSAGSALPAPVEDEPLPGLMPTEP